MFREFEANFLGRAEEDRLRMLLRNLAMGNEERVATFIPKVQRLLLMLTPEMTEREQVAKISEKLKGMYASAIVDKDPETVAGLRDVCRRVKAATDLRRAAKDAAKAAAEPNKQSSQKSGEQDKKSEKSADRAQKSSEKRCHRCGRNTHLVKDCRASTHLKGHTLANKPRTQAETSTKTLAVFDEEVLEATDDAAQPDKDGQDGVFIVNTKTSNLMQVQVQCNSQLVKALLDTGAALTVVSKKLVDEHHWEIEPAKASLSGADSRKLTVVGKVALQVSLSIGEASREVKHVCIVVDDLALPMLLGADLIEKLEIVIDLGARRICFSTNKQEVALGQKVLALSDEERDADHISLPGSDQQVLVGSKLSSTQKSELEMLLARQYQAFSSAGEIGCVSGVEHRIELEDSAKPVVEPMRRRPPSHEAEIQRQVKDMLKGGVIEDSTSPWASAVVLVKKKSNEMRLCIDYRRLNAVTKKDVFPLPNMESCIDGLAGRKWFSSFDFILGYWQVPMEETSKEYTSFRTSKGTYQFKRFPFGLCNSAATYQRMMNGMLRQVPELEAQCYLDDVCVASSEWSHHLRQLELFFDLVRRNNLKLKPSKCQLAMDSIIFLGHEISEKGVSHDASKLRAIREMPAPKDASGVRRVVGCFSYYRRFVPRFSEVAGPLINLTRKNTPFRWGKEKQQAFEELKHALLSSATLAMFNDKDPVILKTDASGLGVAGMLLQMQSNEWRLIACCSRRLSASERNYGPTDLEGLAVVFAIQRFRHYLLGRRFQLVVDHCVLCVLRSKMPTSPRLRRWAILLSEFEFEVVYARGSRHEDVDCLSRAPVEDVTDDLLDDKILYVTMPLDTDGWVDNYTSAEDAEYHVKASQELENFNLRDGLIFYDDRLYVPLAKRSEVLHAGHDGRTGGHGGVAVTMAKLDHMWWPNMLEDVTQYVAQCLNCQLRKADKLGPKGEMRSFEANFPFELLAADTLGPMTESLSGYCYVIVAVDAFTRFVEARAMKTVEATEANQFLIEVFARYGPPNTLITDRGSQFANELVRKTCEVFGTKHRLGTADHGQSNSIAERYIGTLQEKLAITSGSHDEKLNWDKMLPATVLAINTSQNATIRLSPYEMLFGRK